MKKPTFTWNVWIWNFNMDRLETYDVGRRLVTSVESERPSALPRSYEELDSYLLREVRYYFWAKCEYEMIVHSWPELKNEKKVDVYDQLMLNWGRLVKSFWDEVYEPYYLKKAIKANERKKKARTCQP